MFKRAQISLALAPFAAMAGFTGTFGRLSDGAMWAFYILLAFSIVSFLFGMFEEVEPVPEHAPGLETKPLLLRLNDAEAARVAP